MTKLKLQNRDEQIVLIYLSNGLSSTLVIPTELATNYDINKPAFVTIEGTKERLLNKMMEFAE